MLYYSCELQRKKNKEDTMENIKILRQAIRENEKMRCSVCKATGLDGINLNRKLYNPKKFNIGDIVAIKSVLGLTMDETIKIFAPFVAKYNEE